MQYIPKEIKRQTTLQQQQRFNRIILFQFPLFINKILNNMSIHLYKISTLKIHNEDVDI